MDKKELSNLVDTDIPSLTIDEQAVKTMTLYGKSGTKAAVTGRVQKDYESGDYEAYRERIMARQLP
jgi:hypothetical protein